jgi:hypothetical protein
MAPPGTIWHRLGGGVVVVGWWGWEGGGGVEGGMGVGWCEGVMTGGGWGCGLAGKVGGGGRGAWVHIARGSYGSPGPSGCYRLCMDSYNFYIYSYHFF